MHLDDLTRLCEHALCETMPAGLKEAIDAALARGAPRDEILRRAREIAGGQRTLTVLAVEAYLGAGPDGTMGPPRPLPANGRE